MDNLLVDTAVINQMAAEIAKAMKKVAVETAIECKRLDFEEDARADAAVVKELVSRVRHHATDCPVCKAALSR